MAQSIPRKATQPRPTGHPEEPENGAVSGCRVPTYQANHGGVLDSVPRNIAWRSCQKIFFNTDVTANPVRTDSANRLALRGARGLSGFLTSSL